MANSTNEEAGFVSAFFLVSNFHRHVTIFSDSNLRLTQPGGPGSHIYSPQEPLRSVTPPRIDLTDSLASFDSRHGQNRKQSPLLHSCILYIGNVFTYPPLRNRIIICFHNSRLVSYVTTYIICILIMGICILLRVLDQGSTTLQGVYFIFYIFLPLHVSALVGHLQAECSIILGSYLTHNGSVVYLICVGL
jgi:hypothetical protein